MLILASASPRRRELLTQAGFTFRVHPVPVDETPQANEAPAALAQRLAEEKAAAVFQLAQLPPHAVILGADTVVVCGDAILGKPEDEHDAFRMLRMLSGREHQVITGVCLIADGQTQTAQETTRVTVTPLSDAEIRTYIASREPFGKAGAYAIQGMASQWIPRVEGCYFNVVGLPLARVAAMLKSAGILPDFSAPQLG
jgi:septum formation protein